MRLLPTSPLWLRAAGWFVLLAVSARAADTDLASRVVLLANRADPDSVRVARHYAAARGVPEANVIALEMPLGETISWREFVVTIWKPLLQQLVRDRWIDAVTTTLSDSIGRPKYVVNDHRIAALVTCRGVPLRIAHEPEFYAEVRPYTSRAELRTNAGAVDAELSLLGAPGYPINAFIPNLLFQDDRPPAHELRQIVKVSRLDGPTVGDAMALVDRAMAAERTGLLGRAYVDIAKRDTVGDGWMESAARQLAELGFDTSVDRDAGTFPAAARFDAPVLYFGWYASDIDGPFRLPGFQFPPGAIALHIHSFSATTLRSTTSRWTAPLIARGVTATVGNVYEPYLHLTHRPHLLLRALARGATLVDAAYYALQGLSWQAVLIGDPLYRPFAVPLDTQIDRLAELPPRLAGYAVLRRMHQLDRDKLRGEATALAISAQRTAPSLAVGVALARRLRDDKNLDGAGNALGFAPLLTSFHPDEWALAREAALLLEAAGRPARGLDVWRVLLAEKSLPSSVRLPWLRDAEKTARAAGDGAQADEWKRAADELAAQKEKAR